MIKECKITGLKYLCKTTGKNPYEYHGSGLRWVNHLKKYHTHWTRSLDVSTTILGIYDTEQDLKEAGIYYSNLYNVVDDPNWANIVPEEGTGGWINDQTGKNWKIKDTTKMKKAAQTRRHPGQEAWDPNRGEGNYQFKGWYLTPWGKYPSLDEACRKAKELRESKAEGHFISDKRTLKKYCVESNTIPLSLEGRRTPKPWRGKTPQELGFGFDED